MHIQLSNYFRADTRDVDPRHDKQVTANRLLLNGTCRYLVHDWIRAGVAGERDELITDYQRDLVG